VSESILNSIKKLLGLDPSYTAFDVDVMVHINSVLATLSQLGVGPTNGFMIRDADTTWDAFLGDDVLLNLVPTYVYLRVRLVFDPPATSFAIAAFEKQIEELTFRINVHVENKNRPLVSVDPVSEGE
jgi:hypothetical protein